MKNESFRLGDLFEISCFSRKVNDTSSVNLGLYFIQRDETRPTESMDFSIPFPLKHTANGLGLYYSPIPTADCSSLDNCQTCMENYYDKSQKGLCYWCHQTLKCQSIFKKCHFVTGNTTKDHCKLMDPHPLTHKIQNLDGHLEDHYIAGLVGICVLIICFISFCGYMVNHGANNPNSTSGQCLKVFGLSKLNNLPSLSRTDLVNSEENDCDNRNFQTTSL